MAEVRWGILGAAKFAREHMGPAVQMATGARLVALATSDQAKAAPFQSFCPDLRVHHGYEALLNDPEVDAVYIPLPNHLHVPWTLRALEAGKHVLCEKPMAMRASEFDALIAARDASGLLAAEAYMVVHHPQWQLVRARIAAGDIGALRHVAGRFSFDNRADTGNIRNRSDTGGGALRDIGVYPFGSARFALGTEPEEVTGDVIIENGVDTFADVRARFGDVRFAALVSIRMHPFQEMTFHGEGGLIRLSAPFNPRVFGEARVEVQRSGKPLERHRFPTENQYQLQVEAFCRSVTEGVAYPCPLEFSKGTQAMIDRVLDGHNGV